MGDTQNDDQQGQQQQSAGDLRTQLEAEKEKNKQLAARNKAYEQKDKLSDLGFGHLTDRQRRTLIRDLEEEGKDLDEESVKALAEEHGYPAKPPQQQQQQGQNGDGQQQQQQEEEEPTDALTALSVMQQAARMSSSTTVDASFEDEMRKTKSKEELRDLIRSKGPRHGIVHEWDVP